MDCVGSNTTSKQALDDRKKTELLFSLHEERCHLLACEKSDKICLHYSHNLLLRSGGSNVVARTMQVLKEDAS